MRQIFATIAAGAVVLLGVLDVDAADDGRASVKAVDLRCEYRENPLGIDVKAPRVSWKLAAVNPLARGLSQTAYRVLVASGESLLTEDKGDRGDSGEVKSDQSARISRFSMARICGSARGSARGSAG